MWIGRLTKGHNFSEAALTEIMPGIKLAAPSNETETHKNTERYESFTFFWKNLYKPLVASLCFLVCLLVQWSSLCCISNLRNPKETMEMCCCDCRCKVTGGRAGCSLMSKSVVRSPIASDLHVEVSLGKNLKVPLTSVSRLGEWLIDRGTL